MNFKLFLCLLYTAVLTFVTGPFAPSLAQPVELPSQDTVTIQTIQLNGVQTWSRTNILGVIEASGIQEGYRLGTSQLLRRVDQSIDRLYQQGLFSDIQTTLDNGTLSYKFQERSRISNITFEGNQQFDRNKLMDVLLLQVDDPAGQGSLEAARREIKNFYVSEGFGNTTVEVRKEQAVSGRIIVHFDINEGQRRTIRNVYLEYDGSKGPFTLITQNWSLKSIIPVGEGKPYSPQSLNEGRSIISQWYHNQGNLDVDVTAETEPARSANGLNLIFNIEEGPIYQFGDISFTNNSVYSDSELVNMMRLKKGAIFNRRLLMKSLRDIQQNYRDRGYANAQLLDPSQFRLTRDQNNLVANVDVSVQEGQPFYVEKIEIRGNEATYDQVIRREITLEEGELLDGKKKRNSVRRLNNLGFFENVEFNVDPGSQRDLKIVRVKVEERPTGELQFGGGFSSSTGFVGSLSVSKDNFSLYDWSHGFTGRGQEIQVSASTGSQENNFNFSWDDPWFNDDLDDPDEPSPEVPLSFGISAFNTSNERDDGFDESRSGGSIRMGREFGSSLSNSIDLEYSFRSTEVDDIDTNDDDLPQDIENEAGSSGGFTRDIGSIELGLQRDRRDDSRFPSDGYFLRSSIRTAGDFLGGNTNFYVPTLDSRFYIPSFFNTFWAVQTNYETVDTWEDDAGNSNPIPSFEKFFLGGRDSVRGYETRDIAIWDNGEKQRGGQAAYFTKLEWRKQLVDQTLQAFIFTDLGGVSDQSFGFDGGSLKQSAGIGLRVRSPLGPINISWGQRLDETYPGADDSGESEIEFDMGTGF